MIVCSVLTSNDVKSDVETTGYGNVEVVNKFYLEIKPKTDIACRKMIDESKMNFSKGKKNEDSCFI